MSFESETAPREIGKRPGLDVSFTGVCVSYQEALVLAWTRAGGGHQQNGRNRVSKVPTRGQLQEQLVVLRQAWSIRAADGPEELTNTAFGRLRRKSRQWIVHSCLMDVQNCIKRLDDVSCCSMSWPCPAGEGQWCTRFYNYKDTLRDDLPRVNKSITDIAHIDKSTIGLTRSRQVIDKHRGSTSVPDLILNSVTPSKYAELGQ